MQSTECATGVPLASAADHSRHIYGIMIVESDSKGMRIASCSGSVEQRATSCPIVQRSGRTMVA